MIQPAAPNKIVIGSLAILKFLTPFVFIHPALELQRDEYLYYQQGQHPDLGYLEIRPCFLISLIFHHGLGSL